MDRRRKDQGRKDELSDGGDGGEEGQLFGERVDMMQLPRREPKAAPPKKETGEYEVQV